MNELHFIYKIRQHLNRGLQDIPASTADRLAYAREQALLRQKQTVYQSVLATVGNFVHIDLDNLPLRQFVLGSTLVAALVLSTFWMADKRVDELGAIDSALLANDMPVNAFADKGFNAWLKRSSQD